MKVKKIILSLIIGLVILLALVIGNATMAQEPEFQFRAACMTAEPFPWPESLRDFAKRVDEYSDGRIKITVYPAATLGSESDYYQMMMQGVLDFAICSPAWGASYAEELEFVALTFLFKNWDHWKAALDGEVGEELARITEDATDLKTLGYWGGVDRNIITKPEVKSLDDLQGLKLRVQGNPSHIDAFRAIGASPSPLEFGEVYSALQAGVIDGLENEMPGILASKFYEVAKNIFMSRNEYTIRPLYMSGITWRKLPEDLQEVILKAAKEATERDQQVEKNFAIEALELMKSQYGVQTFEPSPQDKDLMLERTRPINEEVARRVGALDLLNKIYEIGKDY